MGRYYHYCDIEYDNDEDKDKEGKPKRKVCDTKCDESVLHGIPPRNDPRFGPSKDSLHPL